MNKYLLHSTCDLADTLEIIRKNENIFKRVPINGINVNISSLRIKTFLHHGTVCTNCGLKGDYFALERHVGTPEGAPYHLNLYGVKDGKDVLFTHDHSLARGLGGRDALDNTQTMCSPCNGDKGKIEGVISQFQKEVRQFNRMLRKWGKIIDVKLEEIS